MCKCKQGHKNICSKDKQVLFKEFCEVSDIQIEYFLKEGERSWAVFLQRSALGTSEVENFTYPWAQGP